MGTESRQRGNKNLLIVTNSAIIGAVDRKELKCLGNLHDMAMFDITKTSHSNYRTNYRTPDR